VTYIDRVVVTFRIIPDALAVARVEVFISGTFGVRISHYKAKIVRVVCEWSGLVLSVADVA
jgi:hypothetical protein